MTLTSAAFAEGGAIPTQYTYTLAGQCNGDNLSPPLAWTGVPTGAQSLALIMVDPDAGGWVHWVVFNLPPDTPNLPEAAGPDLGVNGRNDFGELGYGGPCPPSGEHRYVFTIYVLDSMLPLPEGASRADVAAAMQGHILNQGQLTGRRSRE
jgi:Raf kinase inhibitor-like YbhB/YbcL family protein